MNTYTSRHVREFFQISHQTVKNYATEFNAYLSVTGAPGKGRTRQFTEADLTVFALIKDLKDRGMTYADIHAALAAGERGVVPDIAHEIVDTAPNASIIALQNHIIDLEHQLTDLRTERDMAKGENVALKSEIKALKKEIRELYHKLPRD